MGEEYCEEDHSSLCGVEEKVTPGWQTLVQMEFGQFI